MQGSVPNLAYGQPLTFKPLNIKLYFSHQTMTVTVQDKFGWSEMAPPVFFLLIKRGLKFIQRLYIMDYLRLFVNTNSLILDSICIQHFLGCISSVPRRFDKQQKPDDFLAYKLTSATHLKHHFAFRI